MRISLRTAVLVLALVGMGTTVLASDPPYVGDWKLNPAKTDFGETTTTYEEMADGKMRATADGQSYTFKADGGDHPTPWGSTAAWKAVDGSTWEVTNKVDEKVVGTATMKLADDGKTLTVEAENLNASGKASHDTVVYDRVSGGPGLAGKWKTKNVSIGSPGTMSISASGSDSITLTSAEQEGSCRAKLDGADYPATGPIWPSGWTCSIAKSGTHALEVSWKRNGEVMYQDVFTASADGKTLTQVGAAPGATEKITVVYDRK